MESNHQGQPELIGLAYLEGVIKHLRTRIYPRALRSALGNIALNAFCRQQRLLPRERCLVRGKRHVVSGIDALIVYVVLHWYVCGPLPAQHGAVIDRGCPRRVHRVHRGRLGMRLVLHHHPTRPSRGRHCRPRLGRDGVSHHRGCCPSRECCAGPQRRDHRRKNMAPGATDTEYPEEAEARCVCFFSSSADMIWSWRSAVSPSRYGRGRGRDARLAF